MTKVSENVINGPVGGEQPKCTYELLLLALELDLDDWLAVLVDDLERPVLHVGLDLSVGELSTNETLSIEDGVVWVHGDLREKSGRGLVRNGQKEKSK